MNIKIAKTIEEKKQAYDVRTSVFVKEQQVPPEEELDEFDETAIHFVGFMDEQPIAASRLRFVEEYGKLERICILKEYRGKSFGRAMMEAMEADN